MGNKLIRHKSKGASKNDNRNGKGEKLGDSFLVATFRRSASLRRLSWLPRPHLKCRVWLNQLNLPQYEDAFSKFGGVEEFLYYDEKQIEEIVGNVEASHRTRIMASLISLREKYEKNEKLKVSSCPRSSLIEGDDSRILKGQLTAISPEIILRNGGRGSVRRNAHKREAAILASNNLDEMSLDTGIEEQEKNGAGESDLRQMLDAELRLDPSDLRSYAWYHGAISRDRSEDVVMENGQFIIRDCISQPGDYVLTCRWKNQNIHVIIQKVICLPNTIYERIQYKLEDGSYDSIPDLVTAYVGSKRPVTTLSGAKISAPVNRTAPLSHYLSKYAAQAEHTRTHGTLSRPSSKASALSSDKLMRSTERVSAVEEPGESDLRLMLESELRSDASDIRSHAWYHGAISRERAEEVVTENGHFIIRDCISQPGDFVLTCRWNDQNIHVIIQKFLYLQNTIYERTQYKLEDETYDSIPDLVTAYVGSKRPITTLSGARISAPVNRTAPLSHYLSKYAVQAEHTRLHGTLSRPSPKVANNRCAQFLREPVGVGCSIVRCNNASPPRMRKSCGSAKGQRPSSGLFEERLTNSGDGVLGSNAPNGLDSTAQSSFSSHSLPRRFQTSALSLPSNSHPPVNPQPPEHPQMSHTPECPPPKPSRVPSIKIKPRKPPAGERVYAEINEEDEGPSSATSGGKPRHDGPKDTREGGDGDASSLRYSRLSEVYQPSGSDSGNGSGDSVQTSASDSRNRDSQISLGESGFLLAEDDSLAEDETIFSIPDLDAGSAFDLDNFSTLLLPAIENRPLDNTALKGIKNTLIESGSRILAAHLTKIDLDLLNGAPECDYGLGVSLGIELITLPQGSQLRKDLIERTECLKLLVAISILKTEETPERADLIHRWIQVAIDTKTAMGNLYGFTGIMLGLCMPEVQRLTQTWHTVRQKYTDSAFKFESKLRSTLKTMNECSNPQAPNTIIPHILPFALLCERDLEDIYGLHNKGGSLFQWESTASDYGLQLLFSHLQEGRAFTQNLQLYKRNAECILGQMGHLEELTLDMFRTEFHLKFLFGSKAAFADSEQRLAKFQKVVSTLSEFCEPTT